MKNFKKYFFALYFVSALLFLPAIVATAQTVQTPQQRCDNFKSQFNHAFDWVKSDYCQASTLLLYVIRIILSLSATVAVLFIILGGFWYLSSAGNEERAEKGQKTLTNAIIGLAIIILSFVIVKIVTNSITNGVTVNNGGSGNQQSPDGGGGGTGSTNEKAQFSGPSFADPATAYTFTVTVPAGMIADYKCTDNPSAYVNVASASNQTVRVGSLEKSNGGLTGMLSTEVVSKLGYGKIGDVMPLTLYVCGQNAQVWNVNVKSNGGTATCDQTYLDSVTYFGECESFGPPYVWDDKNSKCTCGSTNQCSQSNNSTTGENLKDCGIGYTCNASKVCVAMSNPNNVPTGAAAKITFSMSLGNDKKTLQVNISGNPSDKQSVCSESSFSKLGNHPLQVVVDGQAAYNGTAADAVATVVFPAPVTASHSVSVVMCGKVIGSGAQTLNPPTR